MSDFVTFSSFLAGGIAGLTVDVSLFPLDTIKTRLQCQQGFVKAGSFNGIYKGLLPQILGSVPSAALFFCTYETFNSLLIPYVRPSYEPILHMFGASLGEVVACLIRVPVEVIKQRRQVLSISSATIIDTLYRNEGIMGLYRGYGSTIVREIPFAFIQFPLYEFLKKYSSRVFYKGEKCPPHAIAIVGAIGGAVAAAATTPLDVVKTRIMLNETPLSIKKAIRQVYMDKGIKGFFAGFVPRVLWITLGGAIFFASYDTARFYIDKFLHKISHKKYA